MTEPFEDDLQAYLGLESLSEVKYFTRLQVGGAVFHSRQYKRVSRRNTFTIAFRLETSPSINYGQIEMFFMAPVGSRTSFGAVVVPLSRVNQDICQQHEVLGRPVSHIIALRQPNRHYFIVVPLEDIIDICVYMAFSDSTTYYAAHFPNHLEKDWIHVQYVTHVPSFFHLQFMWFIPYSLCFSYCLTGFIWNNALKQSRDNLNWPIVSFILLHVHYSRLGHFYVTVCYLHVLIGWTDL